MKKDLFVLYVIKVLLGKKAQEQKLAQENAQIDLHQKLEKREGRDYMSFKYSDYCTCFYECKSKEVWVWDEISDRRIQRIKIDNEDAAAKVMKEWKANAPKNCICEVLE